MSRTTNWLAVTRCAALAFVTSALIGPARAASISYPDQGPIPPGYTFTNIFESTATDVPPLYGPPTPFAIGLSFTPTPAFQATSTGGGADVTDGQLNYTLTAGPAAGGIPQVSFSEAGMYTLAGIGPGTIAAAGASLRVSVTEINGAPISPLQLAPATASVTFGLPANLGSGPWGVSVTVDVASQLALLGFGPGQRATKADVVIDNVLVAVSTPTSSAQIDKDDFEVMIMPEPSTYALLTVALCGMGLIARKRS